nr:phosphatidylinositol mannoside acyltransferase [Acidobacteriota bacterium]
MPDDKSPGIAFRLANVLGAVTPAVVSHVAALSLGGVGALTMRNERRMVERHQRRISPGLGSLQMQRRVNDAFQSYLRYYLETFRLPSLTAREVDAGFTVEGYGHLERGVAAGKGVIVALPHVGGWDWAGRWLAQRGHKVSAVVEVLESNEAFEAFLDVRRSQGINVIPLDDNAGVAVGEALRNNHVVCLMSDRDIQRNGVEVEFFGEKTTAPAGPAFFALRSGAVLLPAAVYFTRRVDGHHTVVRPPLTLTERGRFREDVAVLTQSLITELELLIRRAPEQWHLFSPNWPSDPGYRA